MVNPFVTTGYVSSEYFCDRERESRQLVREVMNGNNLALIATRRMGKTGLIKHCFEQKEVSSRYYTFFIDIYATRSLRDFALLLSKEVVSQLKSREKKAVQLFTNAVKSLQANFTFDIQGIPSLKIGLGDIAEPEVTLSEIFNYLQAADKPCIVAIDEFQQVAFYPEKNVEALLRTHVQHCHNARFIFAGSRRHTMGNMFLEASRPFYQSTSMLHLESIDLQKYTDFIASHFRRYEKQVTEEAIELVYKHFQGITWYVQKVFNALFDMTLTHTTCDTEMVPQAIRHIADSYNYAYQEIMFRLPEKQRELLVAIAKEDQAQALTSAEFVNRHGLTSASSVQAALRVLLEKDFVTHEQGIYQVYDRFLNIWLKEKY